MRTQYITYSLIFLTFLTVDVFAQDTTFLDSKINYYSINGDSIRFDISNKLKGFPRVDYAREIIHFKNDSFKIESCYYFDNIRYSNRQIVYYKIISDSIIITGNLEWHFKNLNDTIFYVSKENPEYIENGYVSSLVPLIKHGDFRVYNKNNKLLLTEQYLNGKLINIENPKINLTDTVFRKVDVSPKFPTKHGDLSKYITERYKYPDIVTESSILGKIYVEFVVTSNGEVINIEVIRGRNPSLDKEAIKVIANLPDFEPGKIKNVNVNSYLVLPVNCKLQ